MRKEKEEKAGAYAGLIFGKCGLRKIGTGGYPLETTVITFGPFVNGIMVILVNFIDFVIFSLLFFSICSG